MHLLAVDGNSIANRAFYGIKMLTNKNGDFTNAIVGFMNIFLKSLDDEKPDCVAIAFDMHAPTFRHKAVDTYKANRKGMPPELREQMPKIKQLLKNLGYSVIETEGFEADDILGTLAADCDKSDNTCTILTGDRDSLQLICKNVTVRLATNKEQLIFDEKKFLEEYGFEPIHLIDLKAIMGDSSDNIKGVAGIGEKGAMKLITEYKTIENIYEHLDAVNASKSVVAKLEAGKEDAFRSKWLATIVTTAPVDDDISAYKKTDGEPEKAAELLTGLEMFSMLERLKLTPQKPSKSYAFVASPAPETINVSFENFRFSDKDTVTFIYDKEKTILYLDGKICVVTDAEKILGFFESECKKYTSSAKSAYHFCISNGRQLKNIICDCEVAAYLLSSAPTAADVEKLCAEYSTIFYPDLAENAEIVSLYGLCTALLQRISDVGMNSLLNDIELPLTEILTDMEIAGVKIDQSGVRTFGDGLKTEIAGLEEQIYFMAGKEFNISSPKQLSEILFEDMGLPCKKKTKTGYSTNADVLESLRGKHPIIELILRYRQLTKLNSTYVDGLLKVVSDDGRIHSFFKQTETRTGRISSTEPNVQNIPVRTELGRNMRKFFVSDEGKILLDADYSQIELRILASVCGDENMQHAFLNGYDIHTITASQVFNMPPEMVTPSMRRAAKAVNFGIIYGIGAFSLADDIGVSIKEADKYIKDYLNHFPNVEKFMKQTVDDAEENGYASTIFGRRRYIPELSSSNKNIKAFGKRAAMNAPIQGAAADIIKIAMVRVYNRLKEEKLDAKLILQVHDELIVETSEKDADKAAAVLHEEMENAAHLVVPLNADVGRGRSWYDAKD